MCVCESLCVFVDVWAKKGSYLRHPWPAPECQEGPLCLLWHKGHTKSCACENLWDRKRKMKRVSQLGVRPRSSQSGAEKQSVRSGGSEVRSETPKQRVTHSELRTWSRAIKNEDTEQWRRWSDESAFFGGCVGFLLNTRVSHYTLWWKMIKEKLNPRNKRFSNSTSWWH